jgi:hypothetical protein
MFTFPNLMGGLIFSSIGFVALVYGRKMGLWAPAIIGVALTLYPFFVTSTPILYSVGIALTVALWYFRN